MCACGCVDVGACIRVCGGSVTGVDVCNHISPIMILKLSGNLCPAVMAGSWE